MIEGGDGSVLFTREELSCRHCAKVVLANGFASELKSLREALDRRMNVNCCCRCEEHNVAVGGHPNSLHLISGGRTQGTCAIDIAVPDGVYRMNLIATAIALGWSVGVYSWGCHLDRRDMAGLPQQVFVGGY